MTKRMLIDSAHPEETRVVLLDGNQLEDFDVEVSSKRQLKGNIYLAKVIRVEPSLQAAFVDYGGNRHGFLAFSEIHPDYYQIPVSDREQAAELDIDNVAVEETPDDVITPETPAEADDADQETTDTDQGTAVEVVGGDDTDDFEEAQPKRYAPSVRRYKIQEVIKRRQVLLIQVVKEERGNKGAALTTYMSLAGRYCVLMPNTARGGGISRKITNSADRKALKTILTSLEVPEGMAAILRTAGIGRTKAEVKRDFEYLIRLWHNVRDLTLQSTAPKLVHEEGDIVRRSIRDLYSRDIEEVLVQGDDAYRAAKEFMKLLIPSHARRVKHYKDADTPLLRYFGIESQMDAMHNPIVPLPSGGYLVINPTEALVSVDVNSGKSTKERNIEETALKTNLEAADALARQLKLRDLAGLVVIDFIDMDINRNNAQVERRMKEALKHDRARIQVGRISPFGLLEMSRQRLRPSLIETSSEPCPYCAGSGIRRSTDSTSLVVLRAIEEEGAGHTCAELTVHVPTAVALYILNNKRDAIIDLERKHDFKVILANDDTLIPPNLHLERTKNRNGDTISEMVAAQRADTVEEANHKRRRRRGGRNRTGNGPNPNTPEVQNETTGEATQPKGVEVQLDENGEELPKRRRRSRRGGRRRNKPLATTEIQTENTANTIAVEGSEPNEVPIAQEAGERTLPVEGEEKPKRRRPRRRRRTPTSTPELGETTTVASGEPGTGEGSEATKTTNTPAEVSPEISEKTPRPRRSRAKKTVIAASQPDGEGKNNDATVEAAAEKPKQTRTRTRAKKSVEAGVEGHSKDVVAVEKPAAAPVADAVTSSVTVNGEAGEVAKKPKRKGWWNLGS